MELQRSSPLLTVVIPVYNVSLYLEPCITSVLSQGLTAQELEVIAVNDGSTDGSELIAEKFAARYENVRVIHQQNGGLSAARNTGLDAARGEFLVFVDSDDVIPPGVYREMLDQVQASGSDFITSPAYRFSTRRRVAWPFNRNIDLFTTTISGATLETHPEFIRDFTAWNKIYRREFFEQTGVRFPSGRIYEDVATSPLLYHQASAFDVYGKPGYFWRVTPGGITQTIKPVKAVDRLWAVELIQDYFAAQEVSPRLLQELGFAILDYNLRWTFLEYAKFDEETRALIIEHAEKIMDRVDEDSIRRVQAPLSDWGLLAKQQKSEELASALALGEKVADLALMDSRTLAEERKKQRRNRRRSLRRKRRAQRAEFRRRLRNTLLHLGLRRIISLLPIDERRIVISNYWGNKFSPSDGPAAIALELAKHTDGYRIVVFASRGSYDEINQRVHSLLPNARNIDVVRIDSLAYYVHLWRAKFLFNDVNFMVGFRTDRLVDKLPGQIEVQTTHGIPLKKMGLDSSDAISDTERRKFLAKSKRYDYLVSSSPSVARTFADAHGVSPQVLPTGLPQNDFLFENRTPAELRAIKLKYGFDPDKKIVLYSPTFRFGAGYAFRHLLDYFELRERLGDEYQIAVKPHPFNHTHLGLIDFRELTDFALTPANTPFVKLFGEIRIDDLYVPASLDEEEGTSSPEKVQVPADINELMLISDVVISDYSSLVFSYALLQKPLIAFTPDKDFYNGTRGSYFDIDSIAPGAVVKNTAEVVEAVRLASDYAEWERTYGDRISAFQETFLTWEQGGASRKILKYLGILPGDVNSHGVVPQPLIGTKQKAISEA